MQSFDEIRRKETAAQLNARIGVDLLPHTVLGFDVYRYASMKPVAQRLVPMVLHPIRNAAVKLSFENNKFIFQKYASVDEINERFIDTGDGGLYVLENPLEALVILIYHAIYFQLYNARDWLPDARDVTGELQLRYVITTGDCYKYRNNFYGSSIINASRTLAKDHLNRILMDMQVHEWFNINFLGLANLPRIGQKELISKQAFVGFDSSLKNKDLFSDDREAGRIVNINEMKLHETTQKATALELFAIAITFEVLESSEGQMVRFGLGNLNTVGLE